MQHLRMRPSLWLLLGLFVFPGLPGQFGSGGDLRGQPGPQLHPASVQGKYSRLLGQMAVPQDQDQCTNFCDWGYAETVTYGDFTNLPKGYWVYLAPNWYIWGEMNPYRDYTMQIASRKGKYDKLLWKFPMSEDWKINGRFKEAGFSQRTEYKNFTNLPPGYWVYEFPYWYIWGQQTKPLPGFLLKASINCKYSRLLRKFTVPEDQAVYPDLYDEGFFEGGSYSTYENLPAGHWVYMAPNWYIWGEVRAGKFSKKTGGASPGG